MSNWAWDWCCCECKTCLSDNPIDFRVTDNFNWSEWEELSGDWTREDTVGLYSYDNLSQIRYTKNIGFTKDDKPLVNYYVQLTYTTSVSTQHPVVLLNYGSSHVITIHFQKILYDGVNYNVATVYDGTNRVGTVLGTATQIHITMYGTRLLISFSSTVTNYAYCFNVSELETTDTVFAYVNPDSYNVKLPFVTLWPYCGLKDGSNNVCYLQPENAYFYGNCVDGILPLEFQVSFDGGVTWINSLGYTWNTIYIPSRSTYTTAIFPDTTATLYLNNTSKQIQVNNYTPGNVGTFLYTQTDKFDFTTFYGPVTMTRLTGVGTCQLQAG